MGTFKEQVIQMIRCLPDDCSLEDIQYHLYVRAKVEEGLRAVKEGRMLTQDEPERRVKNWFKARIE